MLLYCLFFKKVIHFNFEIQEIQIYFIRLNYYLSNLSTMFSFLSINQRHTYENDNMRVNERKCNSRCR